ncbi:MAG: response regulator [Saprospiraceae bacterium]|nr:response regulator [Saprospiraceae bacterium]
MKKIRVLVVEDEPIIAADLEDRLAEMGFEVVAQCSSGEEVLQVLDKETVDLVLMDVQLDGELDGIETAQKMKDKHTVPLIYLTSNADEATFSKALATAPAAFLSKPFRGKDLRHAIELAIARSALSIPEPETAEHHTERNSFLFGDRIFIKVKDRMIRIFLDDILWVEADDYYCKLATREKEYLITQTLKQMGGSLETLPAFMRIHRSYIVNLAHVEEIGELHVTIQKKQIPLNRNAKEELTSRLYKI